MRVLIVGLLLLVSACSLIGPRASSVQEITFSEGGVNYKGDGHGSSVTFRRDGTAEDHSWTTEHDATHETSHQTARFSTDQFERLAHITLAAYAFNEDLYHAGTDSGQSISVVFTNGQKHHASFTYNDDQFRPVQTAIADLSKQLQWQDAPVK